VLPGTGLGNTELEQLLYFIIILYLDIVNVVISDTLRDTLKGIVYPKMKILSSFTHPQVNCSKPV